MVVGGGAIPEIRCLSLQTSALTEPFRWDLTSYTQPTHFPLPTSTAQAEMSSDGAQFSSFSAPQLLPLKALLGPGGGGAEKPAPSSAGVCGLGSNLWLPVWLQRAQQPPKPALQASEKEQDEQGLSVHLLYSGSREALGLKRRERKECLPHLRSQHKA